MADLSSCPEGCTPITGDDDSPPARWPAEEPEPLEHAATDTAVNPTATDSGTLDSSHASLHSEGSTQAVEVDSPHVAELRELTSSFPLQKGAVQKLTGIIAACSPEELTRLGLGPPQRPRVPRNLDKMPVQQRIQTIQSLISAFQYNHTPSNYFNVNKDRPFCRIMDTARDIQRDALPIKCIEGAILGLFFTCGHEDLDRMALRFKTTAGGNIYRHIVLAIRHKPSATWGAVGLSRREELMYKEMGYGSLAALVTDYVESYEKWFHKVLKIRVGLPAEHNLFYSGRINWCYTVLKPQEKEWSHWCGLLDQHTADMRKALDYWRQMGAEAQKEGKDGPMWTAYRRSAVFDNRIPKPIKGQRRRAQGEPYLTSHASKPTAKKGKNNKGAKRRISKTHGTPPHNGRDSEDVTGEGTDVRGEVAVLAGNESPLQENDNAATRNTDDGSSDSSSVGVGGVATMAEEAEVQGVEAESGDDSDENEPED